MLEHDVKLSRGHTELTYDQLATADLQLAEAAGDESVVTQRDADAVWSAASDLDLGALNTARACVRALQDQLWRAEAVASRVPEAAASRDVLTADLATGLDYGALEELNPDPDVVDVGAELQTGYDPSQFGQRLQQGGHGCCRCLPAWAEGLANWQPRGSVVSADQLGTCAEASFGADTCASTLRAQQLLCARRSWTCPHDGAHLRRLVGARQPKGPGDAYHLRSRPRGPRLTISLRMVAECGGSIVGVCSCISTARHLSSGNTVDTP